MKALQQELVKLSRHSKRTSSFFLVTNRVSEGVLKFLFKIFKKRKDDFDE